MKKSLIYGTIAGALGLASLGGTLIAANSSATDNGMNNKIAQESSFSRENANVKVSSKNETVYLITDNDGAIKSTFVGNNLYTGAETLPFEFSVRYYLDGTEISANELAGKSGHVKIVWSAKSVKTVGGKYIPFVAGTGVSLDGAKFSNVKVSSGKVISEGEKYIIAGYSFPGVNEDFGTDLLPEEFSIEADTTGFALDTTYTVLLNDVIADIDTDRLNDLESVVSSVNKLADGIEQISDGSGKLVAGLDSAVTGAKKLQAGADKLADGVSQMSMGASKLSNGINYLTENYNASLQAGAKQVITSTLASVDTKLRAVIAGNAQLGAAISGMLPITTDNYAEALAGIYNVTQDESLNDAKNLLTLSTGIIGYTSAVGGDIKNGATSLAEGLASADKEMPTLTTGVKTLVNGLDEIYNGAVKLDNGIKTFKTDGIDKLVNFAQGDLDGFIRNARQTVASAKSYKYFDNAEAESVKFIVKTVQIK